MLNLHDTQLKRNLTTTTENLVLVHLQWFNFGSTSPRCGDVELYWRVCQYTLTSLLDVITGATRHSSEQPHPSLILHVVRGDELSTRKCKETLLFSLFNDIKPTCGTLKPESDYSINYNTYTQLLVLLQLEKVFFAQVIRNLL